MSETFHIFTGNDVIACCFRTSGICCCLSNNVYITTTAHARTNTHTHISTVVIKYITNVLALGYVFIVTILHNRKTSLCDTDETFLNNCLVILKQKHCYYYNIDNTHVHVIASMGYL